MNRWTFPLVTLGLVVALYGCMSKDSRDGDPSALKEEAKTGDASYTADEFGAEEKLGFAGDDNDDDMPTESSSSATVFIGQVQNTAKKPEPGSKKPVKTWKRSSLIPNTSRLMIGDKEELPLRGLQASVRIDGFRARVLLDLFFENDRDEQFEGTFKLRLPNGASPWFMAFGPSVLKASAGDAQFMSAAEARAQGQLPTDVLQARAETWTQPKVAQVVPKEKAAFAYHSTVRRKVDPALMEWSGAGVFSSRVFPLEPKKLHRIVVGYDLNLLQAGSDLEYRFVLPDKTPRAVVDLNIATQSSQQVTVTPKGTGENVEGRTHYRFDQRERQVVVRIKGAASSLLTGADAQTGPYFAASLAPTLPADVAATKPEGQTGVFLVDASLSQNPERFNVWLKLMHHILERNRETMTRFSVVFFNIETFAWKREMVANTPQNVEALMTFCDGLALEGATDLGAALRAVSADWLKEARGPLFLLSDGAATWGQSQLYALSRHLGSRPLFAYRTGFSGTSLKTLRHLARESGGAVFSVVGEAEVPKAAVAHRSRPWRITKVEVAGTSDLLLAGRPRAIFPGQRLRLAGRGVPQAGASVDLHLTREGERKLVKTELAPAIDSPLTPRVYGQIATGQLEDLRDATEEVSAAYARHFRVAGRTCSLLMLETKEDYERFDIKPEEDAVVVKTTPAGPAFEKALDGIGDALGDPKAGFLAFLAKLEQVPGVTFKTPLALRKALESLPSSAFQVAPPALVCEQRTWKGIPGRMQEQLTSKRLDYMDVSREAQRRRAKHGAADGLRVLSSLVENSPGDAVLARDVAYSAMEWDLGGQAYHLLRRVASRRPHEVVTYLALTQSLHKLNKPELTLAWYEVGVTGQWDSRFGEVRRIMGMEYVRFLRGALAKNRLSGVMKTFAQARLARLESQFDPGAVDLVVTIAWNTDNTDVDLHVLEPTGEECYYSNAKTRIGGRLTTDVTTGYGPEMYVLPKAKPGRYLIRAKYFASDVNRASARTKVYATIYRNWGTSRETVTRRVVTLATGKQMHAIAQLDLGK